ncbi:enoyl-CoA hydratase [Massilia putida]|uniref:enoyl-CoA hydratase n=1 Tax=Massilia putida TaxID=1141883 RepID=UPI00095165F3|nr:enoyl-CoA hydratase [Massilia putida]
MQADKSEQLVLEHLEDGVLTLTLNRPERLNALNPPLMRALTDAVKAAAVNHQARVVVLTGAGKAFCAGGDIGGKPEKKNLTPEEEAAAAERAARRPPDNVASRIDWLRGNMEAAQVLYEMGKPTIAMIRGATVSVGMALAAACDFRVVSERASFTTAFIKVGLTGDYGASWFLTRLLGNARARELMLLSDTVDARRADALGMVSRLVPDEELENATLDLARRLAAGPPVAYRFMKKNLAAAAEASLADLLDLEARHMVLAAQTADHREAVKAFAEKRPPVFTGS